MPPMTRAQDLAELAHVGGATRNMIVALHAASGEVLWQSEERPYPSFVAAGEYDVHNATDGPICYPDAQGIPLISGDGTVYTSSSHHGDLRALKDSNKDGVISPSEVSTFKTGKCFLNSPSIAPGMLVAAPCWGPMYVFKSPNTESPRLAVGQFVLVASIVVSVFICGGLFRFIQKRRHPKL